MIQCAKIFFFGELNRCDYNIPVIGEFVVVKKLFYWNGSFHKHCPRKDPMSKPWFFTIKKGDIFEIIDIEEIDGDWLIYMIDKSGDQINIKYFESRKYWQTKSDIRNNILNKLGI